VHVSTGEGTSHVTFSLYDYRIHDFEILFTLLDYRLHFPGDGSLEFSGFLVPADYPGMHDFPQPGGVFEFVRVDFLPVGILPVLVDDLWARNCAGQSEGKDAFI
jgi:hypothetical protein